MKKIFILSIGLLLFFFISSQNLSAWDEGLIFSLNGGVLTNEDFKFDPLLWTAGFNLDFHFSDFLMLSPEFYAIIPDTEFDEATLAPAALLNLKFSSLFVGAGVTKWFYVEGESSDLLFKGNLGLRGNYIRLVFFTVTDFDNFFGRYAYWLGATLGFEF